MLTDEELDLLQKIVDKTSKGPWEWVDTNDEGHMKGLDGLVLYSSVYCDVNGDESDKNFIRVAKEWFPRLIAEIRALKEKTNGSNSN